MPPILVIYAETHKSRLAIVVAVVTKSNTDLATAGNVFLPAAVTGLPKDSVVKVTDVVTLNNPDLPDQAGQCTAGAASRD